MRIGCSLLRFLLGIALTWIVTTPAWAQFKTGSEPKGTKLSEDATVSRWRTGMVIKAVGGACRGLTGYVPVPTDWPEQQVTIVHEETSPGVRISYEMFEGGVKIMNVRVAQVAANDEVKALVTLEIRRNKILPPENTDIYVLPNPKKLPREIRAYLVPSPKIECKDPQIRKLAKTIGEDKDKAWEHVEAIYDWVRAHIKYQNGPLKGAVAGLRDGTGDCEEITCLFIAICRAADIPARTVWVDKHCYPEFYLEDEKGKGHWFPCQSAGSREFGGIIEARPVLQKGDNYRPPKGGKERQRYVSEYLTGSPTPGGGKPQVRFIRETVPN
jgi:transglutaminase-like putative cysteine protease